MESNSPLDASSTLDAVTAARAGVADRLVTPRWYHPILGALVAQHAFVQGFDERNWTLPSVLILVLGCFALVMVYRRTTGLLVTSPTGPRSRRALAGLVLVSLALILTSAIASNLVVAAGAAACVAVATVLLGRRYDESLREDLCDLEHVE